MDKTIIIEAYHRGLLSRDECTKLLGIDPNILLKEDRDINKIYDLETFSK